MKTYFAVLVLVTSAIEVGHAADSLLPNTISPNNKVAITQRTVAGRRDYVFIETKTGKRLGQVLPTELSEARDVEIEANWSPSGSKVALLISYGTKLNGIFLYSQDQDGSIRRVNFPDLDPIAVYEVGRGIHFPRDISGYEENAIGSWLNDQVVCVIRGNAKEYEEGTKHFLVKLEIKMSRDRGSIVARRKIGILSDEQNAAFFKRWQQRLSK